MIEETKFIKSILPSHYICEPREDGVHCMSDKGISDNEQWEYVFKAIKQRFKSRFMEVYHQTCTSHVSFTVYLRKIEVTNEK